MNHFAHSLRQALLGTVGLAAVNFVQAVLMLWFSAAADYGLFAFLQMTVALSCAISIALFATPMLMRRSDDQATEQAYLLLHQLLLLVLAVAQTAMAAALGADLPVALLYGVVCSLTVWRWFGRALLQNGQMFNKALRSDQWYVGTLLLGTALLWIFYPTQIGLVSIGLLQLAAAILGLITLHPALPYSGPGYWLQRQRQHSLHQPQNPVSRQGQSNLPPSCWQAIVAGFQAQGRPALIGLLSVEASANAHAYLITAFAGTAAFAPFAVAALLFRPLGLVLNSLQQSSRPAMVLWYQQHQFSAIRQALLWMWRQALRALLGNSLLVVLLCGLELLWLNPAGKSWLWPAGTDHNTALLILMASGLLFALRAGRSPYAALLQATDQYSPLARVTVLAAVWVLPVSAAAIYVGGVLAVLPCMLMTELWIGWRLKRLSQHTMAHWPVAVLATTASTPKSTTKPPPA